MTIAALFVMTVLIWGTTWIAIALQVGEVPILVSIFYRFALAGAVMVVGLAIMGRLRRPAQWRFVVVQAIFLFCLNFVGLYQASALIPSGVVSVVFSLASVMNTLAARVFFGDRITPHYLIAGALGLSGLVLLFWQDLVLRVDADSLRGMAWALFGTMMFSLGNMASRKNQMLGVSPVTANAWGMCLGAGMLLLLVWGAGQTLVMPRGTAYVAALVYLAVIGSVAGFTAYLLLVARAGSARAGYATAVFPVVALGLSTLFEGYTWSALGACGVGVILLGNLVMFARA